jgi:hypothetical protein
MAGNAEPERMTAPSAWVRPVRSGLTDGVGATRRTIGRLPGVRRFSRATKAPTGGPPATDERQGVPAGPSDHSAVVMRRSARRVRLLLVIIGIAAQVVIALIGWRITVWRGQRRRERIEREGQDAAGGSP